MRGSLEKRVKHTSFDSAGQSRPAGRAPLRHKRMISNDLSTLRRAVFFDRDGVVNRRRVDDYVKAWEEFEFLPEIFSVLPEARAHGYLAVLVTNQRGVARGLMSEESLARIHEAMQSELERASGATFDAIYFCPHERDAGCNCRKPLPGMLLDAARDLAIDLARSWMIGDSESDIAAGRAAGCRTILIGDGASSADYVVGSVAEAWREIRDKG
jgi:D-glycero-D-manno-heptose 1,7-bisphosphate phosphatase